MTIEAVSGFKLKPKLNRTFGKTRQGETRLRDGSVKGKSGSGPLRSMWVSRKEAGNSGKRVVAVEDEDDGRRPLRSTKRTSKYKKVDERDNDPTSILKKHSKGKENVFDQSKSRLRDASSPTSAKRGVMSKRSTLDNESDVQQDDQPRKKKFSIRLDPYDTSNKRMGDGLVVDETAKVKKKQMEKEAIMSKNAEFRAIKPSPSILSFVEDNMLGRRRLIELKRAGYNIELPAPLDNIPLSKSTERERIEENIFRNKLTFFAAAKVSSSFPPPDLPEIAFVGRSNVGKSSLLNSLTRQWGVARTSDKPGLTQTINLFEFGKLCLVDLPGYGFAYAKEEVKDSWEELGSAGTSMAALLDYLVDIYCILKLCEAPEAVCLCGRWTLCCYWMEEAIRVVFGISEKESGSPPAKLLNDKSIFLSRSILRRIETGRSPVKLLTERSTTSNEQHEDSSTGIAPEKLFEERSRFTKPGHRSSMRLAGISPLNWLPARERNFSAPAAAAAFGGGGGTENWLFEALRKARFTQHQRKPISPENRLVETSRRRTARRLVERRQVERRKAALTNSLCLTLSHSRHRDSPNRQTANGTEAGGTAAGGTAARRQAAGGRGRRRLLRASTSTSGRQLLLLLFNGAALQLLLFNTEAAVNYRMTIEAVSEFKLKPKLNRTFGKTRQGETRLRDGSVKGKSGSGPPRSMWVSRKEAGNSGKRVVAVEDEDDGRRPLRGTKRTSKYKKVDERDNDPTSILKKHSKGKENVFDQSKSRLRDASSSTSAKRGVMSKRSTLDNESDVQQDDQPRKKKFSIRLDPYDTSNKRMDDGLVVDETAKVKKKQMEKEAIMSKNAEFRAIKPSPSILSFVEDNIFRNKLTFFAAAKVSSSFPPPDLPEIAFAGRSNVGKSSLLNSLTRQWGVARTSDKPGLTQTINFFELGKLCLVDLPGYGFAYAKEEVKDSWEELVKEYVSTRAGLKQVCLLIDTKWGMKPRDRELIDLMERSKTKYQIVLTKTDLVFPIDVARRAMQIEESLKASKSLVQPAMMVSSQTGAGIRTLRTVLSKIARFTKV
ncbi:Probable GTP-binding protein EngB [Linum perenne]